MNPKRARKIRRIAARMATHLKTPFKPLYRRMKRYWVEHGCLPPGTDEVLKALDMKEAA